MDQGAFHPSPLNTLLDLTYVFKKKLEAKLKLNLAVEYSFFKRALIILMLFYCSRRSNLIDSQTDKA